MSNTPSARKTLALGRAALQWVSPFSAASAVFLGLLVLIGWQFGLESVKRILPQFVAMNPSTAIGFLLSGITLGICASPARLKRGPTRLGQVLASLVVILGGAKLIAYAGGPSLPFDQVLFRSQLLLGGPAGGTIVPNRMAPNTAFLFVLIGLAFWGHLVDRPLLRRCAKFIAIIAAFAALVAAIGYFNGVSTLYRPSTYIPIALHTVLGFFLLACGIIALKPHRLPAQDPQHGASSDQDGSPAGNLLILQQKIGIGFGTALFLLALIGVVSYASITQFALASNESDETRHTVALIAELTSRLVDAETAARGYVISGQESFLDPYHAALAVTDRQLRELHDLTDDNASEQRLYAQLVPRVQDHLEYLQRVIETRRHDAQAAHALVITGAGKQIMDQIRSDLAGLRETEESQQRARSDEMAQSNRITTLVICAGSLLAFLFVGSAGWVIHRDLSRRLQLETDLRQSRIAADQANATKSQFLANMSHEIRTPMTAIIGYADLLLDAETSPSDRLEHINTIRRNGEHLLAIINDVLDLSKIEAGKFQVERIECCPCKVLSDVASMMRVRAVEKLIRLDVKNEGLIPATILTDPARLRQILINLVGNAIKFTDEGWVRLVMRLQEHPGLPPRLRFDVIDTGIGMTRDQVAQLFQPFVQVDGSNTRRFGGTGLGLTISRRLAEMLGGQISVERSPDRGSTFTLIIDPGKLDGVRRLQSCREAMVGMSPNQPREPETITLSGSILLVDDGRDNRQLLSVYLRNAGAHVTLAENGRTGSDEALVALAEGRPYGVILMDMQMPELDGYGATARLRSKGYTGAIIALTAHAMADDRAKCIKAGCTDYLCKPVRRDDLLAMVARYLNPHAAPAPASASLDTRPHAPAPASAPPAPSSGTIRSDLTDEGLRTFLDDFVGELPSRVTELASCLDTLDLQLLATRAHNLKGTGGLYGLMPITDAAGKVEELIRAQASVDEIRAAVESLIHTLRRVEGFSRVRPPQASTQ